MSTQGDDHGSEVGAVCRGQIISTAATACVDCWRCLRECPAKAIRVRDGAAQVDGELCLACGHCIAVCPNEAKVLRSDRAVAEAAALGGQAWISLAPSWVSSFPELDAPHLIAGLRALGFAAVSPTALGAQEHSAHAATLLDGGGDRVWLSSACPVSVAWVQRQGHGAMLTPLLSPLLAHCRLIRSWTDASTSVVFVGPCPGKKLEADARPDLLTAVLTFDELRAWWAERGIDPRRLDPTTDDGFSPGEAQEGALYPIEGGMLAGMRSAAGIADVRLAAVSGLEHVDAALADLPAQPAGGLFVELLACVGGCVNGPAGGGCRGTIGKRSAVIAAAHPAAVTVPRPPYIAIDGAPLLRTWHAPPVPDAAAVHRALASIGKHGPGDELNCGGCGYDSCRDFAIALACDRAEVGMCVSRMRQLAATKARILLERMPAAAVLVDGQLRIVECNRAFARLAEAEQRWQEGDGLAGLEVMELAPWAGLLRAVLAAGAQPIERDLRPQGRVIHATMFPLEAGVLAGAIFRDVTEPSERREEVVRRARSVIEAQLETVQRIACLLGDGAAATEATLNGLIEAFGGEAGPEP